MDYRQPARYVRISEISPESDVWVRVAGMVVDSGTESLIDDGTGMARVEAPLLEKGKFYRLVCRVIPDDQGFRLRAVAVHEASPELFSRVMEALKK